MSKTYYYYQKGKNCLQQKDLVRAIIYLEKAMKAEPEKASIREALAIASYNLGFYPMARDHFRKALEIDAANHFAYYGLGLSVAKLGKIEAARGQIRIAAVMDPDCQDYHNALQKLTP